MPSVRHPPSAVASARSIRLPYSVSSSIPLKKLHLTSLPSAGDPIWTSRPPSAAPIFFLTRLPDDDKDAVPNWSISDCRDGCVLLVNWSTKHMAAYNPLTWALDLFPTPPDQLCAGDLYVDFQRLLRRGPWFVLHSVHLSTGVGSVRRCLCIARQGVEGFPMVC